MSMQSKVLMALSVLSSTLVLGWGATLTATDKANSVSHNANCAGGCRHQRSTAHPSTGRAR